MWRSPGGCCRQREADGSSNKTDIDWWRTDEGIKKLTLAKTDLVGQWSLQWGQFRHPDTRDKQICEKGSEQIFEYIKKKLKPHQTNMRIYSTDWNLHEWIFKYIWGQSFKEYSNIFGFQSKKSHIRETKHLSTDADSSTDTKLGWTKNTQKPIFFEKRKKSSKTQKLKNV